MGTSGMRCMEHPWHPCLGADVRLPGCTGPDGGVRDRDRLASGGDVDRFMRFVALGKVLRALCQHRIATSGGKCSLKQHMWQCLPSRPPSE